MPMPNKVISERSGREPSKNIKFDSSTLTWSRKLSIALKNDRTLQTLCQVLFYGSAPGPQVLFYGSAPGPRAHVAVTITLISCVRARHNLPLNVEHRE